MARIFSISFSFTGSEQHGLVSVQKTPFFTEYHVSLHDDVKELLLSEKILSSAPGHFVFLHTPKEAYTPFMKEVIKAIAYHVDVLQVPY